MPGVGDERVVAAFGKVPRERFVGTPPWLILGREGYVDARSTDAASLYDDVVVALAPDKRINNGQPSLHARCLSAAGVSAGERVLHVGCGTGYYSAILAELVTASGAVLAWDVESELAARAKDNLAERNNVAVELRSGTAPPTPASDLIYVCAGCMRPYKGWTDALSDGGRLVFPLTPGWDFGGMLMVTRDHEHLAARFICACAFIPCVGGSTDGEAAPLRSAFMAGDMARVSSLHYGSPHSADAWFVGDGWWLG